MIAKYFPLNIAQDGSTYAMIWVDCHMLSVCGDSVRASLGRGRSLRSSVGHPRLITSRWLDRLRLAEKGDLLNLTDSPVAYIC